MGRTKSKDRCPRCVLRRTLCICALIPALPTRTRLIVVMHWLETRTTTNTGRLATLAIPLSEIRLRGQPQVLDACQGVVVPERVPLLLFPTEDATELTPEFVASLDRPADLIVPDGTWKQASKVHYREPSLAGVRKVKLPPGPPSQYKLRIAPRPEAVSTFEAIARAFGILEGPQEGPRIQSELERVFRLMVERTLWSRGRIQAADTEFGISKEAFDDREGTLVRHGAEGAGETATKEWVHPPGWVKR